ncbi:bifunctional polysaccharide deacetylase/glycosyltransferase family 2 protein [Streptomyces albogriseolus]
MHTFSHPDLATRSGDAVDREPAFTQLALAGAAGVHSSLVRMPYSSTAGALDGPSWSVARHLGEKGYVLAFADQDTRDWSRPGARAIADAATPDPPGRGTVVLLHDSGGDRSQTVRALETPVPRLKADGYRFATVAELVGVERLTDGAGTAARWQGWVFVTAVTVSGTTVSVLGVLLLVVGGLVLARCGVMLVLARRHARRARRRPRADVVARTEAPGSLRQLWRQRYRWSYGTMQAAWKHRHALVERGHAGRFGRAGLPLLAVFRILTPLLAPLIDLLAVYGPVFGNAALTLPAWCGVLAVQGMCAAYAFRLDGEPLRPLPVQQIVYQQVMYLVLVQACLTALSGYRLPWQRLERKGNVVVPPAGGGLRSGV